MKSILILRHANSDWSNDNVDDKERILDSRGVDQAKKTAKMMLQQKLKYDTIISSPATRALQTATIIKKETGFAKDIMVEECFYFSDLRRIIAVLRRLNPEVENVLIVGHNPLWSNLVLYLTDTRISMDTGSLAVVSADFKSWEQFDSSKFSLDSYFNPKELKK
ncbi:MAG: histidine phosphatase family protein [Bacteroidales bacterium]|nr:histidine phosphatase family protein [Bacteroidales bacterium]